MLSGMANSADPNQTAQVQSDLGLHCLHMTFRGHPGAFREGEVLRQFQDFREKFWSKFRISLYILYIFTSPSAQDREVSQLRETFSPKSPSTMTPGPFTVEPATWSPGNKVLLCLWLSICIDCLCNS